MSVTTCKLTEGTTMTDKKPNDPVTPAPRLSSKPLVWPANAREVIGGAPMAIIGAEHLRPRPPKDEAPAPAPSPDAPEPK
jgi:hypothetical protein